MVLPREELDARLIQLDIAVVRFGFALMMVLLLLSSAKTIPYVNPILILIVIYSHEVFDIKLSQIWIVWLVIQ